MCVCLSVCVCESVCVCVCQMEDVLERLSAQEKGLASVGATVAQNEQLLKDLETLDLHAEVHTHTHIPPLPYTHTPSTHRHTVHVLVQTHNAHLSTKNFMVYSVML